MNNDQVQGHVRNILLIVAACVIARNPHPSPEQLDQIATSLAALFVVVVAFVWSHLHHADGPPSPPSGIVRIAVAVAMPAALLLSAVTFTGCANKTTVLEERDTNGVYRTTRTRFLALWPATQKIDSERTALTPHGQAINDRGVSQETGSTNVVEALRALDSILGRIAK
jgi:hypothetical protein